MTTSPADHEHMRRALALARQGIGLVEPNPAVGAVVTDAAGEVVGEGFHERFGGPHAEVHALAAAGDRARGGTLYCTLEPCSHQGKTPPCAPLVVRSGVRRVVVATGDPAPHVAGRGFAILREAGLDVVVGIEETDARRLIAPFVTLMTRHRPYVHAKWAMTLDGRIASRTKHSQWISNPESRQIVHALRGRMDAILVGRGTLLADDPLLTARPPGPRTPLRIVLDSRLDISLDSRLVATAHEAPVLIATTSAAPAEKAAALRGRGIEVECHDSATGSAVDLGALLDSLGRRRLTNLLVEGGAGVLGAFRDQDLLDEYHVFLAPKLLGGAQALSPIGGEGLAAVPSIPSVEFVESRLVEGDLYLRAMRPLVPA